MFIRLVISNIIHCVKESNVAKKVLPLDPDNPAGPIPADEISVGDQVEGINEVPADAVAKARADVAREDMSPQHQEGFRRLAAIQHVLEKEQRLLTYREADIHKSVRWFLDIVQGIEKRKSTLAAMTSEAAQYAEALQSASPELAIAHVTAIENLAKQVEANIATLPELPGSSELSFYKERTADEDVAQRKHDLLQLVEDLKYTLQGLVPRDANERNELHQLDADIEATRSSLSGVYSEDSLKKSEQAIQNLLIRAQVEHQLPDTLVTSPDAVMKLEDIRIDFQIRELTQKTAELNTYYTKKSNKEIQPGSPELNTSLRADLIVLYNEVVASRERFTSSIEDVFFQAGQAAENTGLIDYSQYPKDAVEQLVEGVYAELADIEFLVGKNDENGRPVTQERINNLNSQKDRLEIARAGDGVPRLLKKYLSEITSAISTTYNVDHYIALRLENGKPSLQEQQESSAAKLYSFGSKRQGKMPKIRSKELLKPWPSNETYNLNRLGEDYVELDPSINAMVVCDGNSTGECSADAARLVAQRAMEIFRGIPSDASLEAAQTYVNGRVSELASVLDSLESNGGTTVLAARYFPEFNAAVLIDIGDCEAYITNQDGTKRLTSSLEDEQSTDAVQLTLARGDNGTGGISDSRKLKKNDFVRRLKLLPGEALSLITDGPRNNLVEKSGAGGVQKVINQVAQPVVEGGEPNVNVLPKALDTLSNGKPGDDESGTILFAKAAA